MAKRSRAKERKEERRQSQRRSQQLMFAGIGVVVVIFGAIIFMLTSVPTAVELPQNLDRYDGYITGVTDEGYARLGNPNAPVTVSEYSSFGCPGCGTFHDSVFPQLLPLIEEGRINFVYIPLRTGSVQNPDGAARTAICAGEQGQFWEMHDVLFHWQEIYGNSAFQDSRLRAGVSELGLDRGEFLRCFDSNATNAVIASAFNEGVGNTPSVAIDGVLLPNTALETILAGINERVPAGTTFESGLIVEDTPEDTSAEDTSTEVEATEEAVEPETEATEEMEATEEAVEPETEATEESE